MWRKRGIFGLCIDEGQLTVWGGVKKGASAHVIEGMAKMCTIVAGKSAEKALTTSPPP